MITRRDMGVLLATLVLAPRRASADEDTDSLEQKMVETAKTPADHAALAAHYRAEAEKARARMRHHKWMSHFYGGKQGLWAGREHCKRLSKQYGEMAVEYEELAKLHEAEAKKAP